MKLFQPSIFDTPAIAYNMAVKNLVELDTASAREYLEKYKGYAPGENLDLEYALMDFLDDWTVKDALMSDTETGMDLWDQWVQADGSRFTHKEKQKKLIDRVGRTYFKRLSRVFLEQSGITPDDGFVTGGGAVRCLIQGGFRNQAMELARQVMHHTDKPGKILGYMGTCSFCLGMQSAARDTYLQACLVEPQHIDIPFVADPMVRELLTEPGYVCDEHDIPPGPWHENIGWAGATGIIAGIFHIPPVATLHPVINLEDLFLRYEHCITDGKETDHHHSDKMTQTEKQIKGRVFAAGLILSFQSRQWETSDNIMKYHKITDIKRITKRISPELFSMALARLVK